MRMHLSCLQTALCDTSFMNVAKGSGTTFLARAAIIAVAGPLLIAPFHMEGTVINSQLLTDGTTTTSLHWEHVSLQQARPLSKAWRSA